MSKKTLLLLAALGLLAACADPTSPQVVQNDANQYQPRQPACSAPTDATPAMKAQPERQARAYHGTVAFEKSCQPIQ
jgi:uncharacterized lipoprotein YajG